MTDMHNLLEYILNHENACTALANDPTCPPDVLRVVATSGNMYVRHAAARNPNTPADVLVVLSHDPDSSVVVAVARNPACPPELLEKLKNQLQAHSIYL